MYVVSKRTFIFNKPTMGTNGWETYDVEQVMVHSTLTPVVVPDWVRDCIGFKRAQADGGCQEVSAEVAAVITTATSTTPKPSGWNVVGRRTRDCRGMTSSPKQSPKHWQPRHDEAIEKMWDVVDTFPMEERLPLVALLKSRIEVQLGIHQAGLRRNAEDMKAPRLQGP